MSLDHGILNTPLSTRGDIDKQIDRYKAEEFRIRESGIREARKAHKALYAEAKALIAKVSDERMADLGEPHGMTAKQTRKQWLSMAGVRPEAVIRVMRKELGL